MSDLAYTPAELAKEFSCDVRIIDQLIDAGRLPHVRLSPRKVIIPKIPLQQWMADESHASTLRWELETEDVDVPRKSDRRGVA